MEMKPKDQYYLIESPDGKERDIAWRTFDTQDGKTWEEEWYFVGNDCDVLLGDWKIVQALNLFEI
jgi:hypothetical protein